MTCAEQLERDEEPASLEEQDEYGTAVHWKGSNKLQFW